MGLFGRSNADKIADNIREQAKFILLQFMESTRFFVEMEGRHLTMPKN